MRAAVRGSLAATLPYEALYGQSSSSSSGHEWTRTPYTNGGPAPCDKSVDEASASRAARFEAKVMKVSPQSEQSRNVWWEPHPLEDLNSQQDGQHADYIRAAKRAKHENETWTSTSAWGEAEEDWQRYHPGDSVTAVGWSKGGWSDGGQGAIMPVVEQDNTFGQPPLTVHWAAQGQAWNAVKALPGIDLYAKFENAADPTAEPNQAHMQSEAAAPSWHTTNLHSGWNGSHGTTTPVSGGFPGYTSEHNGGAPREEEAQRGRRPVSPNAVK
jgi:hypothetical protein